MRGSAGYDWINFFFTAAIIGPPSLEANISLHDASEVSIIMPLGDAVEVLGEAPWHQLFHSCSLVCFALVGAVLLWSCFSGE